MKSSIIFLLVPAGRHLAPAGRHLSWQERLLIAGLLLFLVTACANRPAGSETLSTASPSTTLPATVVPLTVTPAATPTVRPVEATSTAEPVVQAPSRTPEPTPGETAVPGWPAPVALPAPFTQVAVSAAQQAAAGKLDQARPPERDDIELARLYRGWQGNLEAPPLMDVPLPPGTLQQLNVSNRDTNQVAPVEVELLALGDHAYFWFDTGPGSVRPSPAELDGISQAFDTIYEQSVALFGSEANPGVDGDPRLHIVNVSPLSLCEVTLDNLNDCRIAGYYDAENAIPTAVKADSNAREMFIMSTRFFGTGFYLSTLAHEFRHMIEDNYDRGDADWEAEGSATLASDLLGFSDSPISRANLFLANPDQQLNRWTDGDSIPYYGQAYLLNRYIYDRLGQDLYRQFASSRETGLAAIGAVASAAGLDLTGEELWLDWLATLALHDRPDSPAPYRFQGQEFSTVAMREVGGGTSMFEETVHQFGADYYRFKTEELNLAFEGSSQVPLVGVAPVSGEHFWLANRANYGHMRLTRDVDLRGLSAATLQYSVYHDIEAGYDFAYLFVSTDGGDSWSPLIAQHMAGELPEDDPAGAALAERFYSGQSDGWREEIVDLTPFAGQQISIRFAYVTDLILTFGGLALDNISIPEIGFFDDAEFPAEGWRSEGFERVTATIPQPWRLQLITFANGVPAVERPALEPDGTYARSLSLAESGGEAILIVAATAPQTLELAHYRLQIGE